MIKLAIPKFFSKEIRFSWTGYDKKKEREKEEQKKLESMKSKGGN